MYITHTHTHAFIHTDSLTYTGALERSYFKQHSKYVDPTRIDLDTFC